MFFFCLLTSHSAPCLDIVIECTLWKHGVDGMFHFNFKMPSGAEFFSVGDKPGVEAMYDEGVQICGAKESHRNIPRMMEIICVCQG